MASNRKIKLRLEDLERLIKYDKYAMDSITLSGISLE